MTNPVTQSATKLRISLSIALGLSMIAIISAVIFGVGWLDRYAAEVNAVAYEAQVSDSRLDTMRSESAQLERFSEAADRAKRIVAESQDYVHQDLIIRDLEGFARNADIRIQSYDFTAESSESAANQAPQQTPSAGTSPTSAPGATDDVTGTTSAPAAPAPRSTSVSISIDDPVNYVNLLRFMHQIEQNLTKMQIANITLNSSGDDGASQVSSGGLTIEVYIR